jgi:beta-galactosidase
VEARVRTRFDARGLIVETSAGPRHVPFYAGAMHYWRLDPADWPACLAAIASLGLTLVETYVPWGVHEVEAGRYDWKGPCDLRAFLDEAARAGLGVVLRPGPHVNAELTYFGFPERIVRDPDIQARGAHGGPVWLPAPPRAFPVPSYASAKLHEEVADWYAAVTQVIGDRLAPDGPVVAVGVDNEAQMFFRLGAYDHDYHPDAVAWWQREHPELGEAPRAWDPARAAACVAWVRFKARYLAHALGRFAIALDAAGLGGVARYHNAPPGEPWLQSLQPLERAVRGPVGIDVYSPRRDLAKVRRRGLHLAGTAHPIPLVPEAGCGFVPWLPPIDEPEDLDHGARARDVLIALLAAGARGFDLFMAVDRERYYGAPIDEQGHPRPSAAWIRALTSSLAAIDWPSLRAPARVALVLSRCDYRFAQASSVAEPMTPILLEALGLGPGGLAELGRDDAAVLHRRWFDACADALDAARVPYVIVDEDAPIDRLRGYAAVVAPTLDRVDRGLWRALRTLADEHAVVVYGPHAPTRDELGAPLGDDLAPPRRAGRIRAGSLDDLAGLADDLASLAGDPPAEWIAERPAGVTATPFADPDGRVRAVAVTSIAARAVSAELVAPPHAAVRDAATGERLHATAAGVLRVPLSAFSARLLVVDPNVDNTH